MFAHVFYVPTPPIRDAKIMIGVFFCIKYHLQ
jgi:hypothetical protein